MPNIDAIKAAVCGKKLIPVYMSRNDSTGNACRCFLGELVHTAGVSDEEIQKWCTEPGNKHTYLDAFPVLTTVYGLTQPDVSEIVWNNDDFEGPDSKRADYVLREVFHTSCEG